MVYKRFRFVVVGRVLLLSGFIFLLFYLILRTTYYAATLIMAALIVYQMASLIHYVEKTNRDLTRFLEAIKYSDFSQTFIQTGLGSSFSELKEAFNAVIQKFQQARAEKEEHFRYLQTVVQHIGVGLIAFDQRGKVTLANTAAKRLLAVPHLKNIKTLAVQSEKLVETFLKMESGQRALVRLERAGEELQLSIYAAEFRMKGRKYLLVSLQNIGSELQEKEMEAWQKLIRVLTHEIMNSVTPISSLAATANELLDDAVEAASVSPEAVEDIHTALKTIQSRSRGLLNFVDAYRNLTRIPKPNFQIFAVLELFKQIQMLMRAQANAQEIDLEISVHPESLELTADPELVEQVLINLVTNALQATDGSSHPRIRLAAHLNEQGRVVIRVSDNGEGMMADVLEKIFIPFYTTKKGGSGIGLSLSRQIMRLHHGTLSVQSRPEEGTTFTLRF